MSARNKAKIVPTKESKPLSSRGGRASTARTIKMDPMAITMGWPTGRKSMPTAAGLTSAKATVTPPNAR
jgi:hypothetical protein